MDDFGRLLFQLLRERGMTQKDLADITGLTQSAVSHYIKGDRMPRGDSLFRIAEALHISVDELITMFTGYSVDTELIGLKNRLSMISDKINLDQKMELIRCLFEGEDYIR